MGGQQFNSTTITMQVGNINGFIPDPSISPSLYMALSSRSEHSLSCPTIISNAVLLVPPIFFWRGQSPLNILGLILKCLNC